MHLAISSFGRLDRIRRLFAPASTAGPARPSGLGRRASPDSSACSAAAAQPRMSFLPERTQTQSGRHGATPRSNGTSQIRLTVHEPIAREHGARKCLKSTDKSVRTAAQRVNFANRPAPAHEQVRRIEYFGRCRLRNMSKPVEDVPIETTLAIVDRSARNVQREPCRRAAAGSLLCRRCRQDGRSRHERNATTTR